MLSFEKFSLLNANILTEMINDITGNGEIRDNALKVAEHLKSENGLDQAIKIIEK